MLNEIKEILSRYSEVSMDEMDENSNLLVDIGMNSIDMVNVVCDIEDKYNVQIEMNEVYELVSIGDIEKYVDKLIKE